MRSNESPLTHKRARWLKTNRSEISAEVLATLAEIGEEVNASLDLDEVLARSAALIKRHIDYEIFGVLMFEGGDGSYLRHRFSIGYPRDLAANLRVPLGQGITGTAAATGTLCASAILTTIRGTSTRLTTCGRSWRCR